METITTTGMPVNFTDGAVREIKRLMDAPEFNSSQLLRIGVKGGGCSGMTYVLGFDNKQDNDDVYIFEGIQFLLNPAHAIYLIGMQIHWEGGLNSRGFTFTNPNASKTCGCGTSFAV